MTGWTDTHMRSGPATGLGQVTSPTILAGGRDCQMRMPNQAATNFTATSRKYSPKMSLSVVGLTRLMSAAPCLCADVRTGLEQGAGAEVDEALGQLDAAPTSANGTMTASGVPIVT